MSRLISDIFDVFNRHIDKLREQQKEAYQSIDIWHNEMLQQIGDYTTKQKDSVREAYNIHEKHLLNIRDQVLELNSICWKKNDPLEIDQLLEKCKRMKVELVLINFLSSQSEFIEIVPVEPPEEMYPEELPVTKTLEKNFQTQSMADDGTTASNRTNQSSTTSNDWPTNTTENKTIKSDATNTEKSIDKCPICFMIFPTTMSDAGRSMHVNEHLNNE